MKNKMTIFGTILFAAFILSSCGGSSSTESEATTEEAATTTEEATGTSDGSASTTEESASTTEESASTTEAESTESQSDCDEFIKDYEEFVNSYISIAKKMKTNPSDMSIMSEYTEMASKAATMQTKAGDCSDAKYVDKLAKLATKLATAGM
jgi:hypothetical protein